MLRAESLIKCYAGSTKPAVDHLDLHVRSGEFVSIVGRSGSGKSTLLHILSSLIKPDAGNVFFHDLEICSAPEAVRNHLRRKEFAVVFQQYHLLPYLTALENVLLPFLDKVTPVTQQHLASARAMLERVGLGQKEHSRPGALSGGEQQRVAIARALVRGAQVLFADEPTGNLDFATGTSIIELLHEINREGVTVIMVTHNAEFANTSGRVVRMADGKIPGNGAPSP
ncbi:MAG: ABC transporter ATP-binding protein [Deltaproteobacteria bacterium]|jgi:putative ABC transport system ATP-binding protein|nr:ABC transporter ATP-binding protein [Deltaproteobacteria bacterium]